MKRRGVRVCLLCHERLLERDGRCPHCDHPCPDPLCANHACIELRKEKT